MKRSVLRRGQTAIGLLVSVFLLIGLAAFFLMPRSSTDGKHEKSTLKRSMDMAEGVATDSNLNQIRMAISMFKSDNDGKPPASLEELKNSAHARGITPEMWINPVDKKPFLYDPATGTICAQGPGCPAGGAAAPAPTEAPAAPGVAPPPPPPGGAPAPAAPSSPISPEGPGGVRMKIPQPGAGAAEAMNDN